MWTLAVRRHARKREVARDAADQVPKACTKHKRCRGVSPDTLSACVAAAWGRGAGAEGYARCDCVFVIKMYVCTCVFPGAPIRVHKKEKENTDTML